ncbi:hypothetical protein NDU88_006379 [Pleurodeles waltl]|uniref:Uncharacterized protein n=1 Tax=Pleurodeles waltl TaxID=8319 RepID=A0AAV7MDW9_PLEWA|nr:hypothetical protein NDU88_006379 [Pleurodeles waltl]
MLLEVKRCLPELRGSGSILRRAWSEASGSRWLVGCARPLKRKIPSSRVVRRSGDGAVRPAAPGLISLNATQRSVVSGRRESRGADTALPTPHLVSHFPLLSSPYLQHSYHVTLLEEPRGSTKKTRPPGQRAPEALMQTPATLGMVEGSRKAPSASKD